MPYPKASFGARFVASLIDGLIGNAVLLVAALILVGVGAFGATENSSAGAGGFALGMAALLAGIAWSLWYGFTKDGMAGGQSYGKKAMGLMVVHTPDDLPCTRGQSAVRALVWFATGLVPVAGFLIEPLAAIIDERGRRLGDKAADTQVVPASAYRGPGGPAALRDPSLDPVWDPAMREAMREVDEITRRAR